MATHIWSGASFENLVPRRDRNLVVLPLAPRAWLLAWRGSSDPVDFRRPMDLVGFAEHFWAHELHDSQVDCYIKSLRRNGVDLNSARVLYM
jgi:hypothetical protein